MVHCMQRLYCMIFLEKYGKTMSFAGTGTAPPALPYVSLRVQR